ncbi:flagellar motor switch protein FliM [Desulfuromusa kysingii]|uniref:Flagellar motor switch protein FliM n=1 Tax=Desulfuromusa kysingii TaxID=37625 RepID=A0A1H3VGY7_9BACT|nr:FliM/FliN family flagellar motor switch protein [Desulfuromusa kysingii]SDZ74029.1 flagellar motor switch protein FliM [Desulfuromusa kysingii]
MEKILSKEEIADLLSAVRHGDVDIESVGSETGPASQAKRSASAELCNLFKADGPEGWKLKNYDLILDSFARNYALSLSTRFQRSAQIKLEALESMTFAALLQRLSGHGAIGVLQMEPLTGGALLIFDEQLSFSLVEMVLGGTSDNQPLIPSRSMSAIELNVIRDVINSGCPELNKGFLQLQEIKASLVEVVSNLRLLNFVNPEVGVVAARFKVSIDILEGDITLVLPHTALEPLQKKQRVKAVPTSAGQNSKWQSLVFNELDHMDVEIEATLATLSLRVRDILNFQVGDVIDLGCKPDIPLKVMVENRPKFLAMAGVQGGKKAIRIKGRIPMEDR